MSLFLYFVRFKLHFRPVCTDHPNLSTVVAPTVVYLFCSRLARPLPPACDDTSTLVQGRLVTLCRAPCSGQNFHFRYQLLFCVLFSRTSLPGTCARQKKCRLTWKPWAALSNKHRHILTRILTSNKRRIQNSLKWSSKPDVSVYMCVCVCVCVDWTMLDGEICL